MDHGFKTAAIVTLTLSALVVSGASLAASAQPQSASDANPKDTSELPRGLTIVPWKKSEADKTADEDASGDENKPASGDDSQAARPEAGKTE